MNFIGLKFQLSDEMREAYAKAHTPCNPTRSTQDETPRHPLLHHQHERPLPGSSRRLLHAHEPLSRKLAGREPPLLARQRTRALRPADPTMAATRAARSTPSSKPGRTARKLPTPRPGRHPRPRTQSRTPDYFLSVSSPTKPGAPYLDSEMWVRHATKGRVAHPLRLHRKGWVAVAVVCSPNTPQNARVIGEPNSPIKRIQNYTRPGGLAPPHSLTTQPTAKPINLTL